MKSSPNRWALKLHNQETTDDDRVPRSQKILQVCKLHEMVWNNIFVLIDTTVDDINDRISDPDGLLPAPGDMKKTKYPRGFQTLPRFLMVPYEKLAERCVHGLLLSGGPACQPCLRAHIAAKKSSGNIAIVPTNPKTFSDAKHGPPGFLKAPPRFSAGHRACMHLQPHFLVVRRSLLASSPLIVGGLSLQQHLLAFRPLLWTNLRYLLASPPATVESMYLLLHPQTLLPLRLAARRYLLASAWPIVGCICPQLLLLGS